ncbi:hypothetical protein ATY81_15905 [Rhizobium sp. R72]|uniref:LysR family transcriptional regulator n=1 Tax=unclassified Rhizobium TaxID=2613769 RepID=UPI000B529E94|nr:MULTISPECIES: LysR family transcriptional regulator [unclassified Rhizobium]OWV92657.1 hypothetical protein ATY81_15905 [Rhizobium sp. R72]OWV92868.1 hypothetical protein ATY80_15905 [Rhizobium sp. R711]
MDIARPALNSHIQALEKGLGVRLLKRQKWRGELTRAGEVFYDRRCGSSVNRTAGRGRAGKPARANQDQTVEPATTGVLP